jgi:hypothetical protein
MIRPMMVITTRISTSVKPACDLRLRLAVFRIKSGRTNIS